MVQLKKVNVMVCELSLNFCKVNIHPSPGLWCGEGCFSPLGQAGKQGFSLPFQGPQYGGGEGMQDNRSYISVHWPLNLARTQENAQTTAAVNILGKAAQTQHEPCGLKETPVVLPLLDHSVRTLSDHSSTEVPGDLLKCRI